MKISPNRFTYSLCAAMILATLFAFTKNKIEDPIDRLVAALQKWTTASPLEKVYLHLDKPYYTLGDTIWFKGYVTTGSRHQLSAISGALYVDVINERDSVVKDLKLPITTGMAMGDIVLGDDIEEGNYRIRAYTQWMRNAGEEYFFDKTFTVGAVVNDGIITKADYRYKDIDGKEVLAATLNYTDGEGKPLLNKSVTYRIVIGKKVVWTKSAKTDENGNIVVNINNENKADLTGAYIRTTLNNSSNKEVDKNFPIKAALWQSDVQFFPESGNLINGVTSRIAFKAIGMDGLGVKVDGKIIETGANKEVTNFNTLHAGMGSFILRPEAGKTYVAQLTFLDKSTKSVPLPVATNEGYTLSVYQPNKDSVLVRINTTEGRVNQSVSLIAQTGGETVFASGINISKPITSVWLDKKAFPTGIAQFTLFNTVGEPMNERIAFIKSNDRLQLDIKPNKKNYQSKELASVSFTAKDGDGKATAGNYSVSVIDESKIPSDEANETSIFSSLLLTSDLKGYIEKPNYYFINDNEETDRALDNLMLTQGYRRFAWKDIAAQNNNLTTNNTIMAAFPAESMGISISGKVQILTHKPAADATVTLVSTRAKITKFANTDVDGKFKFDGIFLTDSIKFAVQGRTKKGSDKLEVILDSIPAQKMTHNPNFGDLSTNIPGTLKAYIDAGKKQDEVNIKMGRMDKVHRLREVRVKALKDKKDEYSLPQGPLKIADGSANKTIFIKDGEKHVNLAYYLQTNLPGVLFKVYRPSDLDPEIPNYPHTLDRGPRDPPKPYQVILNGRLLPPSEAGGVIDGSTVDVADIIKVDVVVNTPALTAMLSTDKAALLVYTRRPDLRKQFNPGTVNVTPKGFNKAREFYAPKYDRPNADRLMPDMRTTIHWDPYLKTYGGGKGFFSFFNGDGPGTYRITVEGINADGQLGRQVIRYTVDGDANGFTVPLSATNKDPQTQKLTAALAAQQKKLPIEKVYLQMDKPYYTIGDTLWFKGYITNGSRNELSDLSGALYVDLINEQDSLIRTLKLPAANGMAKGDLVLKDDMTEGNYRIRAYTQWMRNAGEEYFFDRTFTIGSVFSDGIVTRADYQYKTVDNKPSLLATVNYTDDQGRPLANKNILYRIVINKNVVWTKNGETDAQGNLVVKIPNDQRADLAGAYIRTTLSNSSNKEVIKDVPIKAASAQSDVQFFPEGGTLLEGVAGRMAFKVTGVDGLGVNVTGKLLDDNNKELTSLRSAHAGMGNFIFKPEVGRVYTARLTFPDGSIKGFTLPKPQLTGFGLSVQQSGKDSVLVKVNSAPGQQGQLSLVAQSGGELIYGSTVKTDQGSALISLDKKLFPSGIAQFTLFNNGDPVNERIAFIKNSDQLQLSLKPNKGSYKSKEKVLMGLEAMDMSGRPVAGNYSVSVIDETKIPTEGISGPTIFSHLLLSSDIKGAIERPAYYFSKDDAEVNAALDNLMLTQGYRRFKWTEMLDTAKSAPMFAAEGLGVTISGKVNSLTQKPMANAVVSLVSARAGIAKTTTTDQDGRFKFPPMFLNDSLKFAVQARTNNNSDKAIVVLDSVTKTPINKNPNILDLNTNIATTLKAYLDAGKKQDDINMKMGRIDKVQRLRQVNIRAQKAKGPELAPQYGFRIPESIVDQTVILKIRPDCADLGGCLAGVLRHGAFTMGYGTAPFYPFIFDKGIPVPLTIVFNSRLLSPEEAQDVMSQDIDLESIAKIDFVRRSLQVPPSLFIYTKKNYVRKPYNPAMANITPKGFNKTREFYSPKYGKPGPAMQVPDMRSTIYWDPNVRTDLAGGGSFSFYTGDGPGTYCVVIEGIGTDGKLGRQVMRFTVDGELVNGTAPYVLPDQRSFAIKMY